MRCRLTTTLRGPACSRTCIHSQYTPVLSRPLLCTRRPDYHLTRKTLLPRASARQLALRTLVLLALCLGHFGEGAQKLRFDSPTKLVPGSPRWPPEWDPERWLSLGKCRIQTGLSRAGPGAFAANKKLGRSDPTMIGGCLCKSWARAFEKMLCYDSCTHLVRRSRISIICMLLLSDYLGKK